MKAFTQEQILFLTHQTPNFFFDPNHQNNLGLRSQTSYQPMILVKKVFKYGFGVNLCRSHIWDRGVGGGGVFLGRILHGNQLSFQFLSYKYWFYGRFCLPVV